MLRPLLIAMSFSVLAFPVAAQYQPEYPDETEVYESGPGAARQEVKITEMEERLRRMQGSIEQLNFQNRQLKTQLEKALADMDYRLNALEKNGAAAAPAASAAPAAASPGEPDDVDAFKAAEPAPAQPSVGGGSGMPSFDSPRDHYNYAFKLLNKARYDEAGEAFIAFTKKYPKDPLIGNAYYWLGETYYVRRDYPHAADTFREGYEVMKTGPKAADNLLKLAMSLAAQKEDQKACLVLRQVVSKFGAEAPGVKSRAEQEINRMGCN